MWQQQQQQQTPPPQPPADPELRKRIEKLGKYVAKNGADFQALIQQKQAGNPEYAFLFGGEWYVLERAVAAERVAARATPTSPAPA